MALSTKEAGSYTMRVSFSLPSSVSLGKLEQSLTLVEERNPVLRTRFFQDKSGRLYQVVLKDTSRLEVKEGAGLEEYLEEDKTTPMSVGESLSRWVILRNGDSDPSFI
jgi:hypothetical protein